MNGGRGGRTIGAKRSILIEYLGLPLAVRVDPAGPHDVKVGRELLAAGLEDPPLVRDVIADRGCTGPAALAATRQSVPDPRATASRVKRRAWDRRANRPWHTGWATDVDTGKDQHRTPWPRHVNEKRHAQNR